jgi:hypothetical protein
LRRPRSRPAAIDAQARDWFQSGHNAAALKGGVDPGAIPAYLAVMSETLPSAAPSRISWPLVAAGSAFGALLALACALWIYYGTAVFFEIVRAGIAACF